VNPDLIKVTEIFLVPSSFLVAALGTADTNPHRAAISLLGFVISGLWLASSREALADAAAAQPNRPRRTKILATLPFVFVVGWFVSIVVHLMLWNQAIRA
jgi:hypothetical protein